MDTFTSLSYGAEERKRIQNRLAQRRHRLKVSAIQTASTAEADHSPGSSSTSQSYHPSSSVNSFATNATIHWASGLNETDCVYEMEQIIAGEEITTNTRSSLYPGPFTAGLLSSTNGFPIHAIEELDTEQFPHTRYPSNFPAVVAPVASEKSIPNSANSTAGRFSLDEEFRLDKIMDEIFNLGFDNLEAMVIAYYTIDLDENSTIGPAQHLSRKRHIRSVILALSNSARSWPEDEARPLREEILNAAEALYADDVISLRPLYVGDVKRLRSLHWPDSLPDPARLWDDVLSSRLDSSRVETIVYRDIHSKIPEVWSLLTTLVQDLGISPSISTKVVCFLVVLLHQLSDLKS